MTPGLTIPPIASADTLGMSSNPEDRLIKAIWGQPVLMYDRRQASTRRTSWRGGRRMSDWEHLPGRSTDHADRLRARATKNRFFLM